MSFNFILIFKREYDINLNMIFPYFVDSKIGLLNNVLKHKLPRRGCLIVVAFQSNYISLIEKGEWPIADC